jgi:hypothetical protein
MDLKQKTIEYFFKQYKITDPELKAKILPEVTNIIYDYNMLIVDYQKEGDDYKKKQIMRDINEIEDKLDEIFNNFKK